MHPLFLPQSPIVHNILLSYILLCSLLLESIFAVQVELCSEDKSKGYLMPWQMKSHFLAALCLTCTKCCVFFRVTYNVQIPGTPWQELVMTCCLLRASPPWKVFLSGSKVLSLRVKSWPLFFLRWKWDGDEDISCIILENCLVEEDVMSTCKNTLWEVCATSSGSRAALGKKRISYPCTAEVTT